MLDVEDYSVIKCRHFLLNLPGSTSPCHFPQECLFTLTEWLHTPIILMTGGRTDTHSSTLRHVTGTIVYGAENV